MAEEQMSETPSSGNEGQTAAPETSTSTKLNEVYKEYGIEDQAAQFQQARQQPQPQQSQPAPPMEPLVIPDPTLDPSGYQQYQAKLRHEAQFSRQAITQVAQQLTQMQAETLRQREQADIKEVRSVLAEKVPGVDGKVLESYLGVMAQEDPRLMQLWQQRAQKPEAWNKALNVCAAEMASKFSAKIDPQLTENTRAMRAATQAASASRANGSDEKKFSDDPKQFEKEWGQYLSSNTY